MAFIHIFQEWYNVRASKGGPHGLNAGYWLQHSGASGHELSVESLIYLW